MNGTNKKFLCDTLEFCPTGPLGYCFVDEAIRRYANDVIDAEKDILKNGIGGFIDGKAWLNTAKYLKKATDERFEK